MFISECPHCSLTFFSSSSVSPGVKDVLLNPMDRKCFDDMDASSFWLGNLWFHIAGADPGFLSGGGALVSCS